ncbi:MAG: GWxTD domain-containing protein, partial [Gemmatimonadota bacterium]|nr:GWxTD domain-containing protein [Gemmatimonadota bacterium]
ARWGVGAGAGFGSDRGEVYLVLGPPDDVVERTRRRATRPWVEWIYFDRDVRIVFVDEVGFGNYRVANLHTYQRARAALERRKRARLVARAERCPALAPAYE